MVKNIPQELESSRNLEIPIEPPQELSYHSQELLGVHSSPESVLPGREYTQGRKKSPIKFENTAVGCLIQYLRKNGPSSIEDIVRHFTAVEHNLVTTRGGKFVKDAFGIADYAISWNPKLFLLDRHSNYCINEAKAAEAEESFKNRDARRIQQTKESEERNNKRLERQRKRRESWKKIRKIILNDLRGDMENPTCFTKVFLILTSGNKEVASMMTKEIREAYASMIRNNPNSS
ncbi:unnamed protein product [Blepharisma stoltei]|uniref:Uncharacterized protein n=1 Tax=Blepharisma stoltei TaxID=1481888 RepID=A0AAU9K394_9CILI|nr:unnamed protein product [Blepharisma stoltei]